MNLKNTALDKNQWDEFHTEKSIQGLASQKAMMQVSLMSIIDEFTGIIELHKVYLTTLSEYKTKDYYTPEIKRAIDNTAEKFQMVIEMAKRFANFYLVLLDINTYAYNCFLAKDDWEWRVFARHIFTVLYEYIDTKDLRCLFNDVVRIMKKAMGPDYDITSFVDAKKDFVKVIKDTAEYAKKIRVSVDAHFDGEYEERLNLIEEMSYYEVVKVLNDYWTKTLLLMKEFQPVLSDLQNEVNESILEITNQIKAYLDRVVSEKEPEKKV